MVTESVEMFAALMLVLYIAFAYNHIPQPIAEGLASVPGKIVAGMLVFLAAFAFHPSVTLLFMLAVLMSVPGVELYANAPGEPHRKAPGKNIQARKAPVIDTESKLRKANIAKPKGKAGATGKIAPVPDKNTEHFQNPFGVY